MRYLKENVTDGVVAALAGRRIDALGSKISRFPLQNIGSVKCKISSLFTQEKVSRLICSAACGSDLLALEAAEEAGVSYRVVLPFEREKFRQVSVTDRPGDWGARFDRMIDLAAGRGCLIELRLDPTLKGVFFRTNEAIVQEVLAISPSRSLAITIWEGKPRDAGDVTQHFREISIAAGLSMFTISSL